VIAESHKAEIETRTGCVVLTSPFDWLFAKGCLASLRWFMPDLPVTLLIDGDVDSSAAERTYGLKTLRKADIPDPWLRKHSFGWGLSKMVAAWHAPFERFLYLDADTVIWGDLCSKVCTNTHDVVWPIPKPFQGDPHDYVDKWFFQPAGVEAHWPQFNWKDHAKHYACTGTFLMRRNCLKLERYQELMEIGKDHPHLFKFGEMGLLNLMVFEAAQNGPLKVEQADFQVIFPDHPQDSLRQRFRFDGLGNPVVNQGDEQVLHMPDKKPLMDNPECYSKPMTFFRLKYLEDTEGVRGDQAIRRLALEDAEYHQLRRRFLGAQKRRKILGLIQGQPGEWRRLFAKFGRNG
jgi:hypothetical protein